MEERCSGMGAVLRTHASVAAAAHDLSLRSAARWRRETPCPAASCWLGALSNDAEYGTRQPLTRADPLAAAGKSAPEAPAAGV